MPSRSPGLFGRIARVVRPSRANPLGAPPSGSSEIDLRLRVQRLEQMVEALQDQVYRKAQQDDERFAELHHSVQPEELARALSEDARKRGI
jgi:hypothetical protein